ncbi:insulin-like peptide INSL5 [Dromaius novaehollandiae]|uniref:insulin-like peptide INSL5 n=1 Tax=Dromaius novaehollandiae TaxID=8790 RepID=UPI00311FFE56
MRPGLLALALVSVLAAARGAGAQGTPVRLCGRDFVRAIVFTCGGSRWRRHVGDLAALDADGEDPPPPSAESGGFAEPPGHAGEPLRAGAGTGAERGWRGAAGTWPLRKREAARLLPTSCCSVGCSERDLSSLC